MKRLISNTAAVALFALALAACGSANGDGANSGGNPPPPPPPTPPGGAASGTLDASFGAGGKVTTDFSGAPPALVIAKPARIASGGRS